VPYSVQVQGLKELKDGLRGSRGGFRDLRSVYSDIASDAAEYVMNQIGRSVHYSGSSKDGAAHKALPKLVSTVDWGATVNGPWVFMEREDLFLQEFGGTSYWYSAAGMRGLIRQLDTGGGRGRHKGKSYGPWAPRDLTSIAARAGVGGHQVYTKPHDNYGRFIWNTPFRLRSPIGAALYTGISSVCEKHGIYVQMPADPSLDLTPNPWSGA
jgi:hypothetical protein